MRTILIILIGLLIGMSAHAKVSKTYDEFTKRTTYQSEFRFGESIHVVTTIIAEDSISPIMGADIVIQGKDWSVLSVREGSSIMFIIDGDTENVLTLRISSVDNDIGSGYVLEQRIFHLSADIFERFAFASSIKCKLGSVTHTFSKRDILAFAEVLLAYKTDKGKKE